MAKEQKKEKKEPQTPPRPLWKRDWAK